MWTFKYAVIRSAVSNIIKDLIKLSCVLRDEVSSLTAPPASQLRLTAQGNGSDRRTLHRIAHDV